jgi:hypothetical protein
LQPTALHHISRRAITSGEAYDCDLMTDSTENIVNITDHPVLLGEVGLPGPGARRDATELMDADAISLCGAGAARQTTLTSIVSVLILAVRANHLQTDLCAARPSGSDVTMVKPWLMMHGDLAQLGAWDLRSRGDDAARAANLAPAHGGG